jgi:hypothetical protein
MIDFNHIYIYIYTYHLVTHVNWLTNFSQIANRLIPHNHYIKSTYEVAISVLTKKKFKLVIIKNVIFVVCQTWHG